MTAKVATVARHPDGRIVAWMRWRDEHVWLDLEAETFLDGVSGLWFIFTGKAPSQTTWQRVGFVEARIVTYDDVVRKNVDLITFLRRGEAARMEAA